MKRLTILLLTIAACGQVQVTEEATEQTADAETTQSVSSKFQFSPPTPEMLAAALTGDPDKMAATIQLASACHAPTSCQPLFPSCASWSSFSNCGSQFCSGGCVIPPKCSPSTDPNCDFASRFAQQSESFRVCFDAAQNACTEWRTQTTLSGCGCF